MSDGGAGPVPRALIIVDDEVDHALIIRSLVTEMAADLPVEVMTEASGLVERLKQAPERALLLLDRILDGREVFEWLGTLRAARPDLTIAVLSAALSEDDRERALNAGADHAAEKPGDIAGWRALLAELMRLAAARRGAVA